MRVTIIKDDGVVAVDGVFRRVDLSGLFEGVRAVQWDGSAGHVEHDDMTNTTLNNLDAFQPFVDLWTAAAPPPPVPPTVSEMKAAAHARINAAYESDIADLTVGYPTSEIASWPKQEAEARAYADSSSALTPWMDAAAESRGIPKSILANKIIEAAAQFTVASGQLTGKRQKLRDQIDALVDPTQAQLNAIQW